MLSNNLIHSENIILLSQCYCIIYNYVAYYWILLLLIEECSSGNYGFNCDKSCDGCLSNSCDREFGFCTNTSGCKPGRLPNGTHERLECDTGICKRYGTIFLFQSH